MLEINNIQKRYPGFELACSLDVMPGRITGLIGQNGAGKTTLFKLILQLIRSDGGTIRLFSKDIRDFSNEEWQRIGTAMTSAGFSGYLNINDIAEILSCMYPSFQKRLFLEKCEQSSLPLQQETRSFSTGMKAKLNVLIALSHHADFLILDEPTAGLDAIAREEVLVMIRDFMEEDEERAVLISSHISTDLETLCDDFYMIHQGKIILHEETDRLHDEYALLKVNEAQFATMDTTHVLKKKKEPYGYLCLTNDRRFYQTRMPDIIIEKSGIDELIRLMILGEEI